MDNGQMPQVQQPGVQMQPSRYGNGMVQQAPVSVKKSSNIKNVIIIIALSLTTITFAGLFGWMYLQYEEVSSDFDAAVEKEVAVLLDEQIKKDEAEFAEREKEPNRIFSGPADYGQLTFKYPKTWSVYVAKDASSGGDFEAYFNPIQVEPIAKNTVYSLRVEIIDKSFDNVVSGYTKYLNDKKKSLTMSSITLPNGISANRYVGTIPGTELQGIFVAMKIRDKTAVLTTSSMLFENDFNNVISTIEFNS